MRTLALSPDAINCRCNSTRGALFHASGRAVPVHRASVPRRLKANHATILTFLARCADCVTRFEMPCYDACRNAVYIVTQPGPFIGRDGTC